MGSGCALLSCHQLMACCSTDYMSARKADAEDASCLEQATKAQELLSQVEAAVRALCILLRCLIVQSRSRWLVSRSAAVFRHMLRLAAWNNVLC
jgi:hypothetical protein